MSTCTVSCRLLSSPNFIVQSLEVKWDPDKNWVGENLLLYPGLVGSFATGSVISLFVHSPSSTLPSQRNKRKAHHQRQELRKTQQLMSKLSQGFAQFPLNQLEKHARLPDMWHKLLTPLKSERFHPKLQTVSEAFVALALVQSKQRWSAEILYNSATDVTGMGRRCTNQIDTLPEKQMKRSIIWSLHQWLQQSVGQALLLGALTSFQQMCIVWFE